MWPRLTRIAACLDQPPKSKVGLHKSQGNPKIPLIPLLHFDYPRVLLKQWFLKQDVLFVWHRGKKKKKNQIRLRFRGDSNKIISATARCLAFSLSLSSSKSAPFVVYKLCYLELVGSVQYASVSLLIVSWWNHWIIYNCCFLGLHCLANLSLMLWCDVDLTHLHYCSTLRTHNWFC